MPTVQEPISIPIDKPSSQASASVDNSIKYESEITTTIDLAKAYIDNSVYNFDNQSAILVKLRKLYKLKGLSRSQNQRLENTIVDLMKKVPVSSSIVVNDNNVKAAPIQKEDKQANEEKKVKIVEHTVISGENVFQIITKYSMKKDRFKEINPTIINVDSIKIGQIVKVETKD